MSNSGLRWVSRNVSGTFEIDTRINEAAFAHLDQGNDYSFDPANTDFVDSKKVTAYVGGTLVWGEEP